MPLFGRKKTEDVPVRTAWDPLPLPPPARPDGLRTMEDHRDYLLSCTEELPAFGQQLLDAVDLASCEEIVSPISLPGFDNTAMDGYAVRAQDVAAASPEDPVRLPVVGEVAAGQAAPHRLSPGTAMKIMTGAPIPTGADAIVAYESTDRGAADVEVYVPSEVGQHIRRTGEDVAAGQRVFQAGDQLGPRSIGLLAAIGRESVLVRPRPRVAVIATGSELVEPGRPLPNDYQIYDSNSYLLAAAARAAGAQVFRVGLVSDDPERVRELINDQLVRADLILTTGGVSQGDYDVVKLVMPELGATEFVQVAMQPGKPQGFGLIGSDRIPMIMLPGNPVSAFVSFEVFVRPALRRAMGYTHPDRLHVPARLTGPLRSPAGRRQFLRGRFDGGAVSQVGGPGSHLVAHLARANCLVVVPEDVTELPAGAPVDVVLIEGALR
jgi:molybdopterin molybdotransferase